MTDEENKLPMTPDGAEPIGSHAARPAAAVPSVEDLEAETLFQAHLEPGAPLAVDPADVVEVDREPEAAPAALDSMPTAPEPAPEALDNVPVPVNIEDDPIVAAAFEHAANPAPQPAPETAEQVVQPAPFDALDAEVAAPEADAPAHAEAMAPEPAHAEAATPEPAPEAAQAAAFQPEPATAAPAPDPTSSDDEAGRMPAFLAGAHMAPAPDAPAGDAAAPVAGDGAPSPEDTAEIDIQAVEAKLGDPGSTQSFEPITDELIDAGSTYDAGTTTQLMWGARSDVGCVRSHNEDSYLVQSPLFCVCDGMGGHAAGEVASSIAVETIAKTAPHTADPALLAGAIEAANAAVIEAAVNGLGKPGMGCTATAAYIEGTTMAIAHVGDSRAYLLHEGSLIRVTRDHSYVEELVDAGEITADEARVHPNRSVITRALGSDPAMYADHFSLNVEEGDRLIICSDGLSSMISDGEIENIAVQSSTAQICTDNLVDAALAAGGGDNVTVIVVDLVDDGRLREIARKRRRNVIVTISAILIALALAGVVTLISIRNSCYLGIKDDAVAIYTGVPGSFMGIKLSWLEDETSVLLMDLPEDTRHRLEEGIPQENLEQAAETVSKYRKQISEDQLLQEQMANAVRQGTDPSAASQAPSVPADGGDAQ